MLRSLQMTTLTSPWYTVYTVRYYCTLSFKFLKETKNMDGRDGTGDGRTGSKKEKK